MCVFAYLLPRNISSNYSFKKSLISRLEDSHIVYIFKITLGFLGLKLDLHLSLLSTIVTLNRI